MKQKDFFLMVVSLLFAWSVSAQTAAISGAVTDEATKEPLVGVSIVVKGNNTGTTSGSDGRYQLKAKAGDILEFSYLGYSKQEVKVGQSSVYDVKMASNTELEDVVVIGYGAVRKRDLTGAVSSIKRDDMLKGNPTSVNQALQGRMAGVQVNQNDGAPGSGVSITIRGTNSYTTSSEPLYVVDGIPFTVGSTPNSGQDETSGLLQTLNPMSLINPQDIESIEVLKDASATAIYGSRGANGVVLIQTKKGTQGEAKVTFSANFSMSKVVKKLDMLNGADYASYMNEQQIMRHDYEGASLVLPYPGAWEINPETGEEWYNPGPEDYRSGKCASTNWQDHVFRNAFSQEYNISLDGATDKGYYSVSGNILSQDGIIVNSGYNRYSFRANIARKVYKWLEVGSSMNFTNSLNKMVKTNAADKNIIRSTLYFLPTRDLNDETSDEQTRWFASNPYVYAFNSKDDLTSNNFFSSSFLELKPLEGLTLRQNIGYSYNMNMRSQYYNRKTAEGKEPTNGFGAQSDSWAQNLTLETIATYDAALGRNKAHHLNVMGAFSYEKGNYGSKAMSATGFPTDMTEDFDMEAATQPNKLISGRGGTQLVSFLARVNYSLLDKYLFTVSVRNDGASKFAKGNRWATFMSYAGAWRISEEKFVKNWNLFSNLKLRASYGETGNQGIGAYATRDYLGVANYPINGSMSSGYANIVWRGPANPNLKWETTRQYNIGLDMGFLDNKISLTVEYYDKRTKDLLQSITIPSSTGFSNMTVNSGSVSNQGWEITAAFRPINHKDFNWDFNANISFNRNKIGGLEGDQFAQTWSDANEMFLQRNGCAIGTIYGYVEDGFYDNEAEVRADPFYAGESNAVVKAMIGEIKYKDLDGKVGITAGDRKIIGDVNPDFIFGMTHNFRWKDLTFGFFLQGVYGGDIFNGNYIGSQNQIMSNMGNITTDMYRTRWTPDNYEHAEWPKAYGGFARGKKLSDRYVEDGSYLRLKNINLSYRWNRPCKGIASVNFTASVNNVFTITGYSWFDPDVNSFGGDPSRRGVDLFAYPSSRTYSFGIQCIF